MTSAATTKPILAVGALDSQGPAIAHIAECLRKTGCDVRTVDVGGAAPHNLRPDVSRAEVAAFGRGCLLPGEGGEGDMAAALARYCHAHRGGFSGVVGLGALVAPALRALPPGMPRVLVATGDAAPDVGDAGVVVLRGGADGANISSTTLGNAAHCIAGMVTWRANIAETAAPDVAVAPTPPAAQSAQGSAAAGDCGVKIIPFCVPLPSCAAAGPSPSAAREARFGVVGTITLRGPSAVVWLGWGALEAADGEGDDGANATQHGSGSVGRGMPGMGAFALSMPPPPRRRGPAPTTQLLAGDGEEDLLLGQQISARLAARVGWPVFVACALRGTAAAAAGDDEASQRRAAALAEREAARILLREKSLACQR